MTDTKDTEKPERRPLTVSRKSGSGTVKQSFSHGRSKNVVVETKKKRVVVPPGGGGKVERPAAAKKSEAAPLSAAKQAANKAGLSESELKARQEALALRRADEDKRRKEMEVQEAADRRRQDEARRLEEEEEERKAKLEARDAEPVVVATRPAPGAPAGRPDAAGRGRPAEAERGAPRGRPGAPVTSEPLVPLEPLAELGGRVKRAKTNDDARNNDGRSTQRPKATERKSRTKLTVNTLHVADQDRQRSVAAVKRAREKELARQRDANRGGQAERVVREVTLPETITLAELANRMSERLAEVVKYMMKQGELVRGTDVLDADTAELIIAEFGHTVRRVSESDVEIGLEGEDDAPETMKPRAPIVTVMGHVDHGKTSLLDALRSTDVVSGEAGGITQHIGAYQVTLKSGEKITFLDTPGHAAFSAMRARGADATDIVILVVAADDGVMPQTEEAIHHAKAAGVPIIVAVNKIDVEGADPNKVLTQLLSHEIVTTAMSGDVEAIEVSALKRTGLDLLAETISLQAEMMELKANPDRPADGVVIESKLDKGRGAVSTVLVRRGTLKRGEIVVAGAQWGKVKALNNERGQQVPEAGPAVPIEILGLDGTPDPGDPFVVVATEARAREITDYRTRMKKNRAAVGGGSRASLDQLLARLQEGGGKGEIQEAPLIIKGDVQGSVEAITQSLDKLATDEVRARVVLGGAGGISESDVQLAITAGAPIIAFNVRANKQARDLAEAEGVEIRYYSVIYDLLNDVKATLSGMLAPERRETFLGYASILEVFNISKVGKVAGCRVSEGIVKRGCGVRLLRDNVVIHEGELSTLKRFKDEVPEVKQGVECGMAFVNYYDIRVGDQIECFQVDMIERSLD